MALVLEELLLPKIQPIMAKDNVVGVRATWKPNAKLFNSSIFKRILVEKEKGLALENT